MKPVQPRVCGERSGDVIPVRLRGGSAPRVRGTDCRRTRRSWTSRFSPACAGNGTLPLFWSSPVTVQPRVCGERSSPLGSRIMSGGSAPRVRGTVDTAAFEYCNERFSPACAGNGRIVPPAVLPMTVQPRVCGERGLLAVARSQIAGSAPRVRGTGNRHRSPWLDPRFSPACAGNGPIEVLIVSGLAVQPRVCGERLLRTTIGAGAFGSAPRVRGTGACR